MSNGTVIAFSIICGSGTFINAIYYTVRAYRSKTGPMISANKFMPDYSGHFEMDMLPVFVNLITTIQYIGETLETYENRVGFFNQYRYGSYMITCPLMVYETVHTIGAPYAITMFSLTLVTILTAIFADLSPDAPARWAWFTFGCILNVMFCVMLLKVVKHAHRLNDGLCSDKQAKDSIKHLGYDLENFPQGIMRLRTPMDEKRVYIDGAFALMFFLWPIFPIMFVLEYTGCVGRNMTQIIFALTDLIIKTSHSLCLDQYKQGLRHTVFSYGFLDTSILYELHIWDTDQDVYTQLKALSRTMYGDLLVGKKGQLTTIESAGIDYQSMLTANRMNRKVDSFNEESSGEPKSPTLVRRMSSPKVGFAKTTSFRVTPDTKSMSDYEPKQVELRSQQTTISEFNRYRTQNSLSQPNVPIQRDTMNPPTPHNSSDQYSQPYIPIQRDTMNQPNIYNSRDQYSQPNIPINNQQQIDTMNQPNPYNSRDQYPTRNEVDQLNAMEPSNQYNIPNYGYQNNQSIAQPNTSNYKPYQNTVIHPPTTTANERPTPNSNNVPESIVWM